MQDTPYISIIIPTYNRSALLVQTVRSFFMQDYDKARFEIIIADNNSTDDTLEAISSLEKGSPVAISHFTEKRQGVHYARNSAAKMAKGDVLYYTDDDMIADVHLLSEIIKPFFMDDAVATVTGRVLPRWEIQPPAWVLDYCSNIYLSLNDPAEDLIISSYDCGIASCHQAIKKNIFFEAGGFNPENTGGEWIGDGETGLNLKIKELGYQFAFTGKSIIYHLIPPGRMTQKYLNKRLANQGNSDSYTAYKKFIFSNSELRGNLIDYMINYAKQGILAALRYLLVNPMWRLNRARSFYWLNRVKYDYRLIKDEQWRRLVLRDDWVNEEGATEGNAQIKNEIN